MLLASVLVAILSATPAYSPIPAKAPIQACFAESNLGACMAGAAQLENLHASNGGRAQLVFLAGRLYSRAATLAAANDLDTAFACARKANLYFGVGAQLPDVSHNYRTAAVSNLHHAQAQLQQLSLELVRATAATLKHSRADATRTTAEAFAVHQR